MKKKIFKKIINTKPGGLAFQVVIVPPLLAFCTIGAVALWLGAKR